MNEMNEVRGFLPDVGGPTMQATMLAEARLTAEFARAQPEPARHRTAARRRRRYAFLAAGVAGAAVAALIAPTVLDGGAQSAFAVERMPNGTVKVTLHEFVNAAGLERKLKTMKVHAAITYLPDGVFCSQLRATADQYQPAVVVPATLDAGGHWHEQDDRFTYYIHASRIRPGQILVWTMSFAPNIRKGGGLTVTVQEYLGRGPVRPCNPVKLPLMARQPPR